VVGRWLTSALESLKIRSKHFENHVILFASQIQGVSARKREGSLRETHHQFRHVASKLLAAFALLLLTFNSLGLAKQGSCYDNTLMFNSSDAGD
jgi:hypothetical protein